MKDANRKTVGSGFGKSRSENHLVTKEGFISESPGNPPPT
jgi:hypothetical protein